MLEMNWRNMEGKYERVVLEEGFDALTLIPPSGIEKYVSVICLFGEDLGGQ